MSDDVAQSLVDIREDETFLDDRRDLEAAEIYARPFALKPIENDREHGEVADAIKGLTNAGKAADEHRKAKNKPLEDQVKHNNSHYGELLSKPRSAIKALKDVALSYQQAKTRRLKDEERKEQERLDREAEERAAEAQAAAELVAEEPASADARELAADARAQAERAATATATRRELPTQARGAFASLSSRTTYEHEVVDFTALPEDCKQRNDRAIKAKIKAESESAKAQGRKFDLNCISGVEITPKESGVIR